MTMKTRRIAFGTLCLLAAAGIARAQEIVHEPRRVWRSRWCFAK